MSEVFEQDPASSRRSWVGPRGRARRARPGGADGHVRFACLRLQLRPHDQGKDGTFELATSEDRIRLRFCAPIRAAYLVQAGERRPLAVGASIDAAAGTFAWEPGPAFLGQFEFVFELDGASPELPGPTTRVRISLHPKAD